jgi:hypothetical protein
MLLATWCDAECLRYAAIVSSRGSDCQAGSVASIPHHAAAG